MSESSQALSSLNLQADASLLAISCLVQDPTSTAKTSELLADIARDMAEDGTIDDETIGQRLAYNANAIVGASVVKNMEKLLGEKLPYSGEDVEAQVETFLSKTGYTSDVKPISYPEKSNGLVNILAAKDGDVFNKHTACMSVDTDENCPVRWTLTSLSSTAFWELNIQYVNITPGNPVRQSASSFSQSFWVTTPGAHAYEHIEMYGPARVDIYEYNAEEPTRSFVLTFSDVFMM